MWAKEVADHLHSVAQLEFDIVTCWCSS
jgi:hypothetical protein